MAVRAVKAVVTNVPASVFKANQGSAELELENKAGVTLFIGGPDVTAAANHYELAAGASLPWSMQYQDDLWAVAALAGPYELDILISSA